MKERDKTIEKIMKELGGKDVFSDAQSVEEKIEMLEKSKTFQRLLLTEKVAVRSTLVLVPEFRRYIKTTWGRVYLGIFILLILPGLWLIASEHFSIFSSPQPSSIQYSSSASNPKPRVTQPSEVLMSQSELERRRLFLVGKCHRSKNIEDTSPVSSCGWDAIRQAKATGQIVIFNQTERRILVGDGLDMPTQFRNERLINVPVEYVLAESTGSAWSVDVISAPADEPACKITERYTIEDGTVRSLTMPLRGACSEYIRLINSREMSQQGRGKVIMLRTL